MGFNLIKLGDVIEIYSGGTPSKKNPSYWNGSIPWVSAKSMDADAINGSVLYITDEGLDSGSRLAESGTILFLTRGSGLFTRIPVIWVDSPVAYNQDIKCLKAKEPSDARFIYHWLVSQRSMFTKMLDVTGIGAGKINTDQLQDMQMFWPDAITRQRITQVADSLIHAIQLNAQINDYLLQLATVLFEGALETERREEIFADIVELEDSKRIPLNSRDREQRKGPYPYYGATSIMGYVDNYLFDDLRILLGEDGSVITDDGRPVLQYVWGKYWVNNHAHILKPRADYSLEMLYVALNRTSIPHIVTGAVQKKISQKNLNTLVLEMPNPLHVKGLDEVFSLYRTNVDQNKQLKQLRDALLPKLMSGEIDVSQIELSTLPNNHLSAD